MWIPRPLYESLPYLYIAAGSGALTLAFILDGGPRGFIGGVGLVAVTAGLVLWMRRRDYRAGRREYDTRSLDE